MKYSPRDSCFFLFYLDVADEFFDRADTATKADKFQGQMCDDLVFSVVSILLASSLSRRRQTDHLSLRAQLNLPFSVASLLLL